MGIFDWFKRRRTIFGDDTSTTEMRRMLAEVTDRPSDVDSAAISLGAVAAQQIDTKQRKPLLRAMNRTDKGQKRYRAADARVDQFRSGLSAWTYMYNDMAAIKRAEARASQEVDHTRPQISLLTVLLCEVVLVGAEVVFYYNVFTRDLNEDASLVERIIPLFIAVVAPVAAILSVRLFAGAFNRLRESPVGHNEPRWLSRFGGVVALAVSLLFVILVCVATVGLVLWRFEVDDQSSYGTAVHPPDAIFATVFVVMILADACVRAFLFNPGKFTEESRRWSNWRARRLDNWYFRREAAALNAWKIRYRKLEALVAKVKNDADQAMVVSTVGLQIARGTSSLAAGVTPLAAPPTYTDFVTTAIDVHDARTKIAAETDADLDDVALTIPYHPRSQLKNEQPVYLPMREVALAEAYLRENRPPASPRHRRKPAWQDLVRPKAGARALDYPQSGECDPDADDIATLNDPVSEWDSAGPNGTDFHAVRVRSGRPVAEDSPAVTSR
jgi:hypothetical protein